MAAAFVQEFAIVDGDSGVFLIGDVWECREAGQRFLDEKLMPIIERMAAERGPEDFSPPDSESWYELHDVIR